MTTPAREAARRVIAKTGAKPSPGPWTFKASESDTSVFQILDAAGRVIAFARRGTGSRAEAQEFEANAQLLSMAPELLARRAK